MIKSEYDDMYAKFSSWYDSGEIDGYELCRLTEALDEDYAATRED